MIIKSIKLVNFRNHKEHTFNCDEKVSLILGENGSGKTSVLEAIYILTSGKSFRATDQDILKRGQEFYRIELEYSDGRKTTATYDGKVKTFVSLDKKTRRLPKKAKYPAVLFLPSDLNLISSSPSKRRDYFNRVFTQFDDNYSIKLSRYEKALKQRNELLKKDYVSKDILFSWNIMLAKYGYDLYCLRKKFIDEINQKITKTYRSIAENKDEVNIFYETEVNNLNENSYLNRIENCFEKDSYLGHTSFGIHRDDFVFYFNKKPADGSASRGETRSIILALKFIEADLIYEKTAKKPIVLLDDVFSELDSPRRRALIKNFKNNQVIITSVEGVASD